ncbi:MAG: ABC transporter permease [candidate division Zixibacteria bacterium]|nr:ABC transporter permease [candidate division Zixibacteria bacterium]
MITLALIRIAFSALLSHRLRSSLTLLGIIIGVTSVMTIISALEGMTQAVEQDLGRLGPETFIVQRIGIITSDEMFREKIKRKPISYESVDLIERGCDLCDKVAPRAYSRASVKYGEHSLRRVLVGGSTANYLDIVDVEAAVGRFFSTEDDLYRRRVCFIGDQVRETLFEGVDPLGKVIKVGSQKYTVIGVAKKMGSVFGGNPDNFVTIPFSAFIKQFGFPRRGLSLAVKAMSVENLEDAMDQVRAVLRAQRHVPYNVEDDFDILTADSILQVLNSITRIFRFGLVGIASISVVVGGIVVMNIMMVSVTERTREIGIRKSIGAKQKHLLLQFLFESLMLTLSGGIVGIVLGFLIASALIGLIDMDVSPTFLAIFSGLSISTGIGLIFGIYPAMKAARMDPIKALSYE